MSKMNNPIRALINEAMNIWPTSSSSHAAIGCVLSIGTGVPTVKDLGKNLKDLAKGMKEVLTNSKTVADEFADELDIYQANPLFADMSYFRFDVEHGVGEVSLEEWKHYPIIEQATDDYLKEHRAEIQNCVSAMLQRHGAYVFV